MSQKKKKRNSSILLPMSLSKGHIQKIKVIGVLLGVFIIALFLLIATPKAVNLTESKVLTSFNQPWEKPKYLVSEVAGVEKRPTTSIIDSGFIPPSFSAAAVLAQDFESNQILFQKNTNTRLAPASTTKVMTALVAVDHFQNGDILEVFPQAMVGGSSMGLIVGEKLTFRSLLYGMLLNSGNDAAYTIALNYPGGLPAFIAAMNAKAEKMGLVNTHFENPAGFDGYNHYSSAQDLAILAKDAALHPQLSKIVATRETSILSFDRVKQHDLRNLNKLLVEEGVIGIKTGFTEKAGENFIGLVDRNGHKVLTVVLRSDDRFGETKVLMDWVYQNFRWITQ